MQSSRSYPRACRCAATAAALEYPRGDEVVDAVAVVEQTQVVVAVAGQQCVGLRRIGVAVQHVRDLTAGVVGGVGLEAEALTQQRGGAALGDARERALAAEPLHLAVEDEPLLISNT